MKHVHLDFCGYVLLLDFKSEVCPRAAFFTIINSLEKAGARDFQDKSPLSNILLSASCKATALGEIINSLNTGRLIFSDKESRLLPPTRKAQSNLGFPDVQVYFNVPIPSFRVPLLSNRCPK